jgi:hypothetical protein
MVARAGPSGKYDLGMMSIDAAHRRRERAFASSGSLDLMYVKLSIKLTHMEKTQVYLRKEELDALREAAALSGRSVAELVREAIRKVVLKRPAAGPVAIWDGEPKRASVDHDSVHDEP